MTVIINCPRAQSQKNPINQRWLLIQEQAVSIQPCCQLSVRPTQSSVTSPSPSGLLQLSNWPHTCLTDCKYYCLHLHSRLLSCGCKSQVKDRASMWAALHSSSQITTVLKGHQFGPEKTRLRIWRSDERRRSFQTAGGGRFSLSRHYRGVINKSTSL